MVELAASADRLRLARSVMTNLAVIVIGLLLIIWVWLRFIDTAAPIESVNVTLLNSTGQEQSAFKRGDPMLIRRTNCASRRVQVSIARDLVSDKGVSFAMPAGPYVFAQGCETNTNALVIPPHIPPGHYRYRVTVAGENNLFSVWSVVLKEPDVLVLP